MLWYVRQARWVILSQHQDTAVICWIVVGRMNGPVTVYYDETNILVGGLQLLRDILCGSTVNQHYSALVLNGSKYMVVR